MVNNDILRSLRYTFDVNDSTMMKIFEMGGLQATRAEISDWLKKDEDPAFRLCADSQLATFLNGFIVFKRGKKDGPQPVAEEKLNNNIIFRKIKIALNLQSEDILELLKLANLRVSAHELSAFFRKPDHKHYRVCKEQILRNFLKGVRLKNRPSQPEVADESEPTW